jgi:hypothetical protein
MEPAADSTLVLWLRLLGWTVETGRDGDAFVAVARRLDKPRLDVEVRTGSEAQLPLEIFSAALKRLETHHSAARAA